MHSIHQPQKVSRIFITWATSQKFFMDFEASSLQKMSSLKLTWLRVSGCPDGQAKLARRWRWGKSATGQVSLGQKRCRIDPQKQIDNSPTRISMPSASNISSKHNCWGEDLAEENVQQITLRPKSWDSSIHWWISNDVHGKQALKKVIHWFTVSHYYCSSPTQIPFHQSVFFFWNFRMYFFPQLVRCSQKKQNSRNPLECFLAAKAQKPRPTTHVWPRNASPWRVFFPQGFRRRETFRRRLGELFVLGSWPRPLKSSMI